VARHHPVRQMVQVLSGRGLCTEMRLQELSAAEVMAYATGHLGGPVEPALAALLYRHTGGHALFLVQMLEHLAQQGLLVRAAGQWTLREDGATTTVGIPAQLQHLVTRRFEALPTTTQCVGGSGRGRPRVYRGGRGGGTAPPHSGGRQSV
jgi:predicted ATPase